MAVGLKSQARKTTTKKASRRKPASPVQEVPPREAASSPAPHVVGKLTEREPEENAHRPREAPEAAERSSEGLDAGYARYTESSDFINRGRDRS